MMFSRYSVVDEGIPGLVGCMDASSYAKFMFRLWRIPASTSMAAASALLPLGRVTRMVVA